MDVILCCKSGIVLGDSNLNDFFSVVIEWDSFLVDIFDGFGSC